MLQKATKYIGLLVITLLVMNISYAQNALVKTADHHFDNMAYAKAIDAYEQAVKKKGMSNQVKFQVLKNLGDSYMKVKDAVNAERVYRELVSSAGDFSGENSKVLLSYAQALASNAKYKESQEVYQKYNTIMDADPRGKSFSKLYNDVSVLSKNASCYKVDYLTLNTNAADFSPTKYQNGLIFVSNRTETNGIRRVFSWNNTAFLDLFHLEDVSFLSSSQAGLGGGSKQAGGKGKTGPRAGDDEYTSPTPNDSRTVGSYGGKNLSNGFGSVDKPITKSDALEGSINSKYHEGPAAFFKDGSKVLFTRNNLKSGKAKKSSDGIVKLKLYLGEAKKDGWGNAKELPFNSDEYSTGHPALSADEKLMFFTSDMPGGYGGTDIYVTRYDGTNWSAPINMGKEINTKGHEMFPYVDEKGSLYFSSDGHPGLGELDIFYTLLDGVKQKGRIINIGAPLNSSKDDFGIIADAERKTGYFSSNRKRGGNDDDIYKFDRECELKEGCELLIAVIDAESKMPLDNTKVVYADEDGNNIELFTDADGMISIDNIVLEHSYSFNTTREGYANNTTAYKTDECENQPSRLEIALERPKPVVDTTENVTKVDNSKNPNGDSADEKSKLGKTCTIKGKVAAQSDKKSLSGVTVSLKNSCDGTTITAMSDEDGNFEFTGTEGCDYTIEGKKAGMASKSSNLNKFNCASAANMVNEVLMFTTGDIVQIDNIYFDYGKCNLRKDAKKELDKLVKMMRDNPKMRIELSAHTDSRSEADFNQKISEGRAKASAEYLFKRGISRARVEYKGYGESQLINQCADGVQCSEDEHAKNRRTEIKILSME
jgi:outer membrane protein OmpA-like peptidoglycan-associated protein/tetratricopeptide (TPR) repeat protein